MSQQTKLSLRTLASLSMGNVNAKQQFHRRGTQAMRDVVARLNLPKDSYRISSNLGGDAVSGEVVLHLPFLYVQVAYYYGLSGASVLIRGCNGLKDYCGSVNHYTTTENLEDPDRFIGVLRDHTRLFTRLTPEAQRQAEEVLGRCYSVSPVAMAA